MEKQCAKCGFFKPLSEFARHKGYGDGLQRWCKSCFNGYQRQLYSDPVRHEEQKNRLRRRYHEHPRGNAAHLKMTFGLTPEEYQRMLGQQDGVCAICRRRPEETTRKIRLGVDHDHDTGEIRGLLCNACNAALGYMDDDIGRLQSAIAYLRHHERTFEPLPFVA